MAKIIEVESVKAYQKETIDQFGQKIVKTDFGDQADMPRVMVVDVKYPNREARPMKKVVAEVLEARGEIKIVKGVAPDRPTIEDAKETAEKARKEKAELTR